MPIIKSSRSIRDVTILILRKALFNPQVSVTFKRVNFLLSLVQDVTSNCISEVLCLALDEFNIKTVQTKQPREKNWQSQDSNLGLLGGMKECFLCATQPPKLGYLRVK